MAAKSGKSSVIASRPDGDNISGEQGEESRARLANALAGRKRPQFSYRDPGVVLQCGVPSLVQSQRRRFRRLDDRGKEQSCGEENAPLKKTPSGSRGHFCF